MLDVVTKSILRAKERWDDESYFARIVFCDLVEGAERELTGFGIAPYLTEEEFVTVEVEPEKQEVRYGAVTMTFQEIYDKNKGKI